MDAEELYGLPLERFVDERTALAKALRNAGQREEATRVSKLPKPSLAAWAVNQLIRTQGRLTRELFEAGDALKQAQADVVAGRGNASSLREAADRERAVVSALTDVARGLLTSTGHGLTAATLERVSETLNAAALEDSARPQVECGCLTRELRHIGLGESMFAGPAAPRRGPANRRKADATATPSGRGAAAKRRRDGEAARRRDAERVAAEEAKRVEEARRRAGAARDAAEEATVRREAAVKERDRAAQILRAAEQALTRATAEAEAAEAAHRQAEQELGRM